MKKFYWRRLGNIVTIKRSLKGFRKGPAVHDIYAVSMKSAAAQIRREL